MTPKAQAPEPANQGTEFIEYVGESPYWTEFTDHRVITRKDAKEAWNFTMEKDMRWSKNPKGRMLLPSSEVPAEILERLLEDKAFKVVTE